MSDLTEFTDTALETYQVTPSVHDLLAHREGFGMPVLEAGLLGIPVFATDKVPSALEIGKVNMILFSPETNAEQVANLILRCMEDNAVLHLRRRVRQTLTWKNIFEQRIIPLLAEAYYDIV